MSNPDFLTNCLTFSSDILLTVFLIIFLCLFAPISVNKRIVRRVDDLFNGGDFAGSDTPFNFKTPLGKVFIVLLRLLPMTGANCLIGRASCFTGIPYVSSSFVIVTLISIKNESRIDLRRSCLILLPWNGNRSRLISMCKAYQSS